jgi:hypothetical protein
MEMEKIERYIQSVSSKIPESQRYDFEKELKRDIVLMLAERLGSKEPTDIDIDLVLADLGDSSKRRDNWRDKKRYRLGKENGWFFEAREGNINGDEIG